MAEHTPRKMNAYSLVLRYGRHDFSIEDQRFDRVKTEELFQVLIKNKTKNCHSALGGTTLGDNSSRKVKEKSLYIWPSFFFFLKLNDGGLDVWVQAQGLEDSCCWWLGIRKACDFLYICWIWFSTMIFFTGQWEQSQVIYQSIISSSLMNLLLSFS